MADQKQLDRKKASMDYNLVIRNNDETKLSQVETAAYISDIVLQLRNIAKAADLKFLVYFLEMAFQEAFTQSTRDGSAEPDSETGPASGT